MNFKPLAFVGAITIMGSANASVAVWLDYAGFDSTIVTAWTNGGYSGGNALTAGEILGIKNDVQTKLQSIYSGFTISFNQSNPGGVFETLRMGATTTTAGLYGQADRLDWRNKHKDDVADIYAANFDDMVLPGSFTRTQNLERIKNALAGTAAHELGHNLGLQHYDPYGIASIQAPSYGGITGQQNNQIMATGGTGLTSIRRGDPRAFGLAEKIKLEYAEEMTTTPGQTIAETGAAHGSIGQAQLVTGNILPITGTSAVNITGQVAASGQVDFYRFEATAGSLLSANAQSQILEIATAAQVDSIITLHDSTGAVLVTNDDISYSGNSFMQGTGTYGTDSLIQNFVATYTGTYYVSLSGFQTDTGSYELLLTGMNPVPEPATMAALGAGVLWMARRRRAKKS